MITAMVELVLAGVVRDDALRQAIAGDLLEDYALVASARGQTAGTLWLMRQLIVSFPQFASLSPGNAELCFTARNVIAFYGTLSLLVLVATACAWIVDSMGALVSDTATSIVALPAALAVTWTVVMFCGYAIARLTRQAPLVAALGLGVISTSIGVGAILLAEYHAPLWYVATTLVFGVPATLTGALLYVRSGQRFSESKLSSQ